MPRGWLIPRAHVESGRYAAAIDRLRWHGLRVQSLPPTRGRVERFVIERADDAQSGRFRVATKRG